MYFSSNDYPLSKEYQSRMERKVSAAQLADEQKPKRSYPRLDYRMGFFVIALLLIGGLFLLFAQDVSAQEAPGFDPGVGSESVPEVFQLGVFYLHREQYEKAIEELTKVVDLDPEFGSAFAARGVAYHSLGMFEEAIADYSSAILIFPDYASAYNFRGLAYLEQGDYEEALSDGQYAAELDTTYANPHLTMGEVYMAMEDYESALDSYEHYVELAGDEATPLVFDQIERCKAQLEA